MRDRAHDFLLAFNGLEDWLRSQINSDKHLSFFNLVNKASESNRAVKINDHFLKSMGNLRNAIVHDKKYPDRIIAVPDEEVVEELQQVCQTIYNPPKLLTWATHDIKAFDLNTPLVEILLVMRENDFSQIVIIRNDNSFGMLTREGVAMWVEANIKEDIVSLKEVSLKDIYQFEDESCWRYLPQSADIYEGAEIFSDTQNRIQALIITNNGKNTEKPLGLVTLWDMRRMFSHG